MAFIGSSQSYSHGQSIDEYSFEYDDVDDFYDDNFNNSSANNHGIDDSEGILAFFCCFEAL